MNFLGIGPWEVLLILIIAFALLGPSRMVRISRSLGKGVQKLRKSWSNLERETTQEIEKRENPPKE